MQFPLARPDFPALIRNDGDGSPGEEDDMRADCAGRGVIGMGDGTGDEERTMTSAMVRLNGYRVGRHSPARRKSDRFTGRCCGLVVKIYVAVGENVIRRCLVVVRGD